MPRPLKQESKKEKDVDYVCHTCSKYMKQGRMAPMSNQNKLQLVDKKKYPELDLKEVENQLVAPNLIFQKSYYPKADGMLWLTKQLMFQFHQTRYPIH